MLFFISHAQAIDDVLLMQSIGIVGYIKLRENTVCMCENKFQKNQTNIGGKLVQFQKNQTKPAGNWFQKSSKYFAENMSQ